MTSPLDQCDCGSWGKIQYRSKPSRGWRGSSASGKFSFMFDVRCWFGVLVASAATIGTLQCVPRQKVPPIAVPQSKHTPIAQGKPYACGALLAPDRRAAIAALDKAYIAWRRIYVTGEGANGQLRIRRPEDQDDTVSEGIGYGMLIAAYHGDREIFDRLLGYGRRYFDGNGLMHWKIAADGRVRGNGGATDADEDIAMALLVADRLWGGEYGVMAKHIINGIWNAEVEPGTYVLKPGSQFGGSLVMNPSYLDPAYYRIFAKATGNAKWNEVVEKTYRMFDSISKHNDGTGLAPDWMTSGAGPAKGQSYDYKYDAARVPLRLARDAAWFCEPRAQRILAQINAYFTEQGPLSIGDGYTVRGKKFSTVHNAAFVGPVAASALFPEDDNFRRLLWKELVRLWGGGYYANHLRHLALLFVSGLMPSPLDITPMQAATD